MALLKGERMEVLVTWFIKFYKLSGWISESGAKLVCFFCLDLLLEELGLNFVFRFRVLKLGFAVFPLFLPFLDLVVAC